MKQNAQKLLTWLYSPSTNQSYTIDYPSLALVLPNLTPGGRRSLIHYLVNKLFLRSERINNQVYVSVTSHGVAALATQFPVFNQVWQQWQGQWSVIVFKSGPSGDPHFRYLRQLLLDHHAFTLSRGVYLYPGQLPGKVNDICRELYVGAVVIMSSQGWLFGDERRIVSERYSLLDLIEVYSGISREIKRLLELKNNQKGLTLESRKQIYSVFDRLFTALTQDPGFWHYYYPQITPAPVMLTQLHSMLSETKA